MSYHGFVAVQGRGTVALPAELRRKYRLDEAGAQLEMTERDDGVIELRPTLPVRVDEIWFWSAEWQAKEHQADADRAAGRHTTFDTAEEFLGHLDHLDAEADSTEAGPASNNNA